MDYGTTCLDSGCTVILYYSLLLAAPEQTVHRPESERDRQIEIYTDTDMDDLFISAIAPHKGVQMDVPLSTYLNYAYEKENRLGTYNKREWGKGLIWTNYSMDEVWKWILTCPWQ